MDKSHVNLARDYMNAFSSGRLSDLEKHKFIELIMADANLSHACDALDSDNNAAVYILATVIAEGIFVYYDDNSSAFNAKTKNRLISSVDKILLELDQKKTLAFECEFEQRLLIDLLHKLKNAKTPQRGRVSDGDPVRVKRYKLIKIIASDLVFKYFPYSVALVADIVSIIDPDISWDVIEKTLQRSDIKIWEERNLRFFSEVYSPYIFPKKPF